MSKQKATNLLGLFIGVLTFTSCAVPNYLPGPTIQYPTIENVATFGVQNMDENAKVETNELTCHYDGFNVKYKIDRSFVVSFIIENNSNKSLIIDKSKSYVLYDGYSTQLFKDVRSSRSTTFNNVQDAINNVQTNEAGVSMTIPPYSKWELPLQETNVRGRQHGLPAFRTDEGIHPMTPFDNKDVVEFVIPYSYDYSLAKWSTCRNRIYINSIEVKKGYTTNKYLPEDIYWKSNNQYALSKRFGEPDYTEANRIDEINAKMYHKHHKMCHISHIVWSPVLAVTIIGILGIPQGCLSGGAHEPQLYGNKPIHFKRRYEW